MENLLEKTYIHIGTDQIQKDLWYDVQNQDSKPIGGLWTSPYIKECVCDWLEYVGEHPECFLRESMTKGCMIYFDPYAKLLNIRNKSKEDLDFEEISKHYDLFYVHPEINKDFSNWSVRTMYVLNPEVIKRYIPLEIESTKISPYHIHYSIKKMGEFKQIEEYSDVYHQIFSIFMNKYKNILSLKNKTEIKKNILEECKKELIKDKKLYYICDAIVENEYQKVKKIKVE